MKTFTLVLAMSLFSVAIFAQFSPKKIEKGGEGMYPSFVEFSKDASPSISSGGLYLSVTPNQSSTAIPIILNTERDRLGGEHTRLQQTFNNIPIEGAIFITHATNGKLLSQNGKWIQQFPSNIETSPAINKEAAIRFAMADFGASSYKWQSIAEEQFIKNETNNKNATFYPAPELVYYSGEDEITPAIKLAYKMDIYASEPLGRRIYFVDARSGEVLGKRELIHTTDATGSAVTAYSGTQTITSDLYSGSYRLREIGGRGNGIQTFNMKKGTNYSTAVDFTDADNSWDNVNANLDQYATDAHWGAEKTYDYFKTSFDRNSIDGNGFALKSYVHYSSNYFNAFWDGTRMTYGDGNATNGYKPLTAIDVAAHEITHGLTSKTANLVYSNESGALNEAFSDIFGTAIEVYARPTQNDWLIGADFYTLRSMSNPNAYGDPDTYKGTNWYFGTADNGGVHTNSGVLNYWFYLLTDGGSGSNDFGTAFNVTGLGIIKAAAIAYRTLTTYLISTSKYADARFYSIKSAEDLYGVGSNEATQTTNAWIAVGVGNVVIPPACTDVYESNNTRNTAKSISVNTDISATIASSTDKDYFAFTTTSSAPKINVTLNNLPADYDMRLYNSNGKQLAISQNTGTTAESIIYNATSASTYYVYIYGYNGANSPSCYLLRVNTSGSSYLGEPDEQGITSVKDGPVLKMLSMYPNPVKDVLTIKLSAEEASNNDISIINSLGQIVYRKPWMVQKGLNNLQLNLPKLAPGVYFVKTGDKALQKIQVVK